jgi:prepilin-type N-terminal cleavage/methylation domain-containing protein
MRGPRAQDGFTLIELLVAMSLTTVVVMATVSAFVSFHQNERLNRLQNESQDQARMTIDTVTRQLRNLASPKDYRPESIELATPYDLVFRTVDAVKPTGSLNSRNIKRVRYCLSESSAGEETLWRQQQTWVDPDPPLALPSTSSCPSSAWGNKVAVATDIVSLEQTPPLELFSYTPGPSPMEAIRAIRADLVVDVNPGKAPRAVRLTSGVFLRNQNRAPVADCTATYSGNGKQVVLNGSASEDPEGHALNSYTWYLLGDKDPIATKVVSLWSAPKSGSYTIRLVVEDHGGLLGEATCPVEVP